ncbi:sulfite exporter TauE/SafE family protein [Vagococcus vulneris]|uniref:Probable membrane transporter protein n=1 Tax=Vagococcus vulneris TaxID=1977869 RepID=A0A429ZX65_9ENTE|nr:sulfite exporter TauE/SafE family protein [Vagococcus vulneris]RST98432.1 hypothetical protein CBF37_07925 [Vagococcus vulneris]
MSKVILLGLIIIVNFSFLVVFVKDVISHRQDLKEEKANSVGLGISSFLTFFLSTFGISDFAIGTVLYPKMKWVSMKKLPGTLNTQCVIPVATMALSYISSIEVGVKTLVVCIVAQVIGAYIGPKYVVKLPERTIKLFVGIGLIIAAFLIFAGQMNWIPSNGIATDLYGGKLILTAVLLFIYGALNNIGIGSYSLTMVTVYLMGLNPIAAFPIMMGACTFSVPIGSMQFVKFGEYSRKITLFTSTFGVLGVLVAVFLVKSLNTYMLKWLVIIVLLYSSYTMLQTLTSNKKISVE